MGSAAFPRAAIATPHHLATDAGTAVLASGGNAMDAAIAANLTLGVVAPYLCGFGGDLFALVWRDGLHAFDGSGRAAAGAMPAALPDGQLPARGPWTVTVPGAVDGWFRLLTRFGSWSFGDLAADARRFAAGGLMVSGPAAAAIHATREGADPDGGWSAVYGRHGAGDVLTQPGLVRTIDALAEDGPSAFYRGPIADAIAAHIAARGGPLRDVDLIAHRGEWIEPLTARIGDLEVVELPPATQGVTVLQAASMLERIRGTARGIARAHLMVEAVKVGLVDRDTHLGDRDGMRVRPEALLAPGYIDAAAGGIDPRRAAPRVASFAPDGGTAYLCTADADGMMVSLIQSNFMGFGSLEHVGEWGINLHNRGACFTTLDGHPNRIGPAKRPLHTLIPAMVLRDGEPWMAFGTMGGHGQPSTHIQLLEHILGDGLDPGPAIAAPRWMADPATGRLYAERDLGRAWIDGMRARGHEVQVVEPRSNLMGHAQAILRRDGGYVAAADPRSEGTPGGR